MAKILAIKNNDSIDEPIITALIHNIGKSLARKRRLEMCVSKGITIYDLEM